MPAIPNSLAGADALDNYDPMSSKRSSGAFGVALTSTPSHDECQRLPSQFNFSRTSWNPDAYGSLIGNGDSGVMNGGRNSVGAEDLLASKRAGDRSSMRSVNGNANGGGGTPVYDDAGRRRTQYYEEQFKNGAGGVGRERVQRGSPVVAELKTNVIIKDEFTLVTDLSHHLAQRYTRPDSAVMIRIDHSVCLALGGTFEPCYILNIQTVPSQMGPTTNKRNASLIQSFMTDILSVPPERGIVTFTPIAEENLAMGGKTMLAEMEKPSKAPTTTSGATSAKSGMSGAEAQRKNAYRKSLNEARSSSYLSASSAGNGAAETPNTSQSTTPTPSLVSEANSQANEGRPSTAHGSAVNGLRMNGISTENLVGKAARTPNGRPKTFGGTSSSANSIQEQIKPSAEPMPHVSRQSTTNSLSTLKSNGQRASKVDIKKIGAPTGMQKNALQGPGLSHAVPKLSLTPATTTPTSQSTTALPTTRSTQSSEPRTKNTYLDNVSTLTQKTDLPRSKSHTVIDDDDEDDGRGEANTGRRRRSTMTATPKIPAGPPPVPDDSKETKSTRSLRLGKRKSFLKGFMRRSTQG